MSERTLLSQAACVAAVKLQQEQAAGNDAEQNAEYWKLRALHAERMLGLSDHKHDWRYNMQDRIYKCDCGATSTAYPFGPADYKD